jgi:hypothetical protein
LWRNRAILRRDIYFLEKMNIITWQTNVICVIAPLDDAITALQELDSLNPQEDEQAREESDEYYALTKTLKQAREEVLKFLKWRDWPDSYPILR